MTALQISATAATCAVLVTLVGVVIAARSLLTTSRRARHQQRAETTLNALDNWHTKHRELALAMRDKNLLDGTTRAYERLVTEPLPDGARTYVREILEGFEMLALGVRVRAYDANLVNAYGGAYIINARNMHRRYIDEVQKTAALNAKPYEHLDWLADRLGELRHQPDVVLPGTLEIGDSY
jgi:hypothetical protein